MADTVLCVLPHRDGKPHTQDVGLVCGWHRGRLDTLTTSIADDFLRLALIAEAGSAPKDRAPKTRHLKAASPPAPANLDVLVLTDPRSSSVRLPQLLRQDGKPADMSTPVPSVLAVVASWVVNVADGVPLTETYTETVDVHHAITGEFERTIEVTRVRPMRLPSSVIGQLDLLRRHHDWIAAQGWVDDYLLELSELQKAISAALRDRSHRFVGKCYLASPDGAACGGDLLRRNGDDAVVCKTNSDHAWRSAGELARLEIALSGTGRDVQHG